MACALSASNFRSIATRIWILSLNIVRRLRKLRINGPYFPLSAIFMILSPWCSCARNLDGLEDGFTDGLPIASPREWLCLYFDGSIIDQRSHENRELSEVVTYIIASISKLTNVRMHLEMYVKHREASQNFGDYSGRSLQFPKLIEWKISRWRGTLSTLIISRKCKSSDIRLLTEPGEYCVTINFCSMSLYYDTLAR